MAEQEEETMWPGGFPEAKSVNDFDFLMTGKNNGPITKIPKSRLGEVVGVVGESMAAIQGGATSATAVALPAGPIGQNRWFDASWGYWKYNNVVLKNPTGTNGIPQGNDGTLYWNGTATTPVWTISKMQALPTVDTSTLVSKSDIKSTSVNLFDKNTMVLPNTIINSDGELQAVTGGVTARIDISGLKEPDKDLLISWRGKLGANGPYYAFYEGATMKSYAAYNNNLSKTVTAPPTSNILYITVKSAADASSDVYANFMVNVGATALAYKPYEGFITQIDGKKIPVNQGEAYDQPLNKADSVAFKEVTTDLVKTESLVTNEIIIDGLPKIGTKLNPPAGLMMGDPWLDTTDSSTDPIVRYRIV